MKIKTIPKFPDYLISSTGIIFSIAERANRGRPKKPVVKSLWKSRGYFAVDLQFKGIHYKRYVHRLILETFVGPCPIGYQCRHLDGNPLNNNLKNLKWGTRSENQMDRLLNGRDNRGEKHGMNKLSKNDVLKIRELARSKNKKIRKIDNGGNYKEIAKSFGVSPSTVGAIVRGSAWKWL